MTTAFDRLMMFPLPGAVLLPGVELPLHIFEPRYRQMVQDAIDLERPIAIGTIDDRPASHPTAVPGVLPMLGVGALDQYERLPDGRFIIVLKAFARIRMLDEWAPSQSYREIRAVEVPDEPGRTEDIAAAFEVLRGLALSISPANPRLAQFLNDELSRDDTPSHVANRLVAVLGRSPELQYRALETLRVSDRLDTAVDLVSELAARLDYQSGPSN